MPVNTVALGPGGTANNPLGLEGTTAFGDIKLTLGGTSVAVAAMVVNGSATSFVVIPWVVVVRSDVVATSPAGGAGVSSVSSGLVPWSHCTQSRQVEFRLSNVSTLVQNQTAQTWNLVRFSVAT